MPSPSRPAGVETRSSELTPAEFRSLHQSQAPGVWNYACYRLGPDEAEDATAEVFARAWAVRDGWRPERGTPAAWLWGIARHVVSDGIARRMRVPASLLDDDVPAIGADPAERLSDVDRALAAVARLPDVDQEIIALRFGAGHTNRAIAGMITLSESNVAQRLRRALRVVRSELADPD